MAHRGTHRHESYLRVNHDHVIVIIRAIKRYLLLTNILIVQIKHKIYNIREH